MNIDKFYAQQRKYNQSLTVDPNLDNYKLIARKYLSLHVKLSTLANETKCFKYWIDANKNIKKNIVFDKYIECLSHILTIGLDSNYTGISEITVKPNDYCLSDQFLNLYVDINDLIMSSSKDHYETLLEDFISLGISLSLSEQQIEDLFFNDFYNKIAL
ncbi:dUTP diphosphatase [Inconstantimicrobium mannanitabidum]|uniref:Uncharacterized protein n=1 Tax=Inconstantimicrobium mannanitabidum TaxID=1604901 RepID=A0ACB5RH93_9CLOT|nr:dUTP diphosphatase [Clostridium sp. TW13]GKX68476.1 hypothetical protein rsdtw13_37340 [Clostridium sp. TW13]